MNGLSVVYIKRGNAEAKARKYREAFEDYASSLLSRISGDIDMTLEFVAFYRYQLLSYLRAKPVFTLSLPEGDMITDLIVDSYFWRLSIHPRSTSRERGGSTFWNL